MAEGQRMTAAREAVEEIMRSEHADVLRESVALVVRELMETEVAEQIGAELGECVPDERVTQRNGYRARRWDTRVGEIELAIPKLRSGSYFPSFLEPRKRSEQALVAVVQEAYVNGVSTRKVDRLVEQLGLRGRARIRSAGSAAASTTRYASSASASSKAPTHTYGSTPRSSASASRAACARRRWCWPMACMRPDGARCSGSMSARPRARRSGASSCAPCGPAGCAASGCASRTPRGTAQRDRPGAQLPVATLHRALHARHARPRRQGPTAAGLRRHPPALPRRRRPGSARAARAGRRPARRAGARRSRRCWKPPRTTCWPSTRFRPSTGPSSEAQTRSSASTARSGGAPT
jgi:Transposase, Mutator family